PCGAKSFDAAGFASCCRPLACTFPGKARPRASTPRSPQTPADCYKGDLVPPCKLISLYPVDHGVGFTATELGLRVSSLKHWASNQRLLLRLREWPRISRLWAKAPRLTHKAVDDRGRRGLARLRARWGGPDCDRRWNRYRQAHARGVLHGPGRAANRYIASLPQYTSWRAGAAGRPRPLARASDDRP